MIYLMDLVRYLELKRQEREVVGTVREYISMRDMLAYGADVLKLNNHKVIDYGFSPSGKLLYAVNEAGFVAVWHTDPFAMSKFIDPPDDSWRCPDSGCEGQPGRNQSAMAEDMALGIAARLRTSLTECGGDNSDCVLVSNLSLDDLESGLTVQTFEFQERTGPLWQRLTMVDFDKNGNLLVGNGHSIRQYQIDQGTLSQRICKMAGDQSRLDETDAYLNEPLRTLFPKIGRRIALCRSYSQ